jgi:hypothetical protein
VQLPGDVFSENGGMDMDDLEFPIHPLGPEEPIEGLAQSFDVA